MMLRRFRARHIAVLLGALVAGGALVGAVVAAQGGQPVPEGLEAAIASEPLVKVLDLPAASGAPSRSMFVQPTSAGFLCVWDAPSAGSRMRQGGCNRSDDPLGGRSISASLAYDGGPAIEGVDDARLIGLAVAETASVHIEMNDGSSRDVKLKKAKVGSDEFQAFGYRFKKSDLGKGIGPSAIVAYDAAGIEIGRQPTGIGG
jgi:hypothetical protein